MKCFVVPPRHLKGDIPVLPSRVDNYLMFSGCKTCARELRGCGKKPDYQCPHFSDQERGDSVTITTLELEMALKVKTQ